MSGAALVALQSVPFWLPTTSPWLHRQLSSLPQRVEAPVVTDRAPAADRFPMPSITALSDRPPWEYLWDKVMRRTGVRNHLGLVVRHGREVGADVLHSHWGDHGWRNLAAAAQLGIPHIVTFYGKDLNFLPRQDPTWCHRYREMFTGTAMVTCEGPHMARMLVDLGCNAAKTRVIHLGVDPTELPFIERSAPDGRPVRCLMAASFRQKKGIPIAVAAIGTLRQRGYDVELTIIGDSSDDPRSIIERDAIHTAITAWKLESVVHLLGYRSYADFLEIATHHDVFLAPSVTADDGDTEGGAPVSVIDASGMGMVLVVSDHCDLPEVVLHTITGRVARESSMESLTDELMWVLDNPEAWPDLSTQARLRVESEFNAPNQSEQLARVYEEVL